MALNSIKPNIKPNQMAYFRLNNCTDKLNHCPIKCFLMDFMLLPKKGKNVQLYFPIHRVHVEHIQQNSLTVDSEGEGDFIEAEVIKLRGRNIYIYSFILYKTCQSVYKSCTICSL